MKIRIWWVITILWTWRWIQSLVQRFQIYYWRRWWFYFGWWWRILLFIL